MTACLVAVALLFHRETGGAIRVWTGSPTYNHCFLILPLSYFLIWERRNQTGLLRFSPNFWGILALFGLSILWLLTAAAGVLEAQQFVALTILQAALLTLLGLQVYRKFAAPFLYLYFLVPSGAFLIPFLQAFTARFAVAGLHLLGIPVFSTGAVIEIPAGTFAVAEACAGLRFLIAAVAFGTFFAILNFESWWRRGLFIALSILVPIIANGLRALGLIAAAEWLGSPAAAMADHVLYGWLFFALVLMALILIGQSFSDRHAQIGSSVGSDSAAQPAFSVGAMAAAGAICLIVASFGPVLFLVSSRTVIAALPSSPPVVQAFWKRTRAASGWHPVVVSPERAFADSFQNGRVRLDRFIALYSRADANRNLVRSQNRDADERVWTFNSSHVGRIGLGQQSFSVSVSRWLRGQHSRTVWSFFLVDGKPAASGFDAKLNQIRRLFHGSRCASAYVALSIEDVDERVATQSIAKFMQSNEPLTRYLCTPSMPQGRAAGRK